MNKRVVVAMSGGVDSSVTAALLKRRGFDVIGIFMKLWSPEGTGVENRCCNVESLEGARRVATLLKIPFYVIDLTDEFKNYVVDYYIKEYSSCRTPNPCAICNKFIKFDFLLKKILGLGADYLATGHYVRLQRTNTIGSPTQSRLRLLRAKDKIKDQSYFLWTLTQERLKHLLFPIGEYTKGQVREMAGKWGLPTAGRAESQGLCFIGYWNNQEFLAQFIKPKPGPIVDLKGNILGKHQGLPFYTIGQRKGIEIEVKRPDTPPLYVVNMDRKNNALIVGEEKGLYCKELEAKEVNWIAERDKREKFECWARIRYGHPLIKAQVETTGQRKVRVIFGKPVWAVTPGQSVVFYQGEEVLGGGVIQ